MRIAISICLLIAPVFGQAEIKMRSNAWKGGDRFGEAVAIAGELVAVGSGEHEDRGAVFLYSWSHGGPRGVLEAQSPMTGERFGAALASEGDHLVVGVPGASRVEVFDLATGQRIGVVSPTGSTPADEFGASVAVQGNRALVGAPGRESVYLIDLSTLQISWEASAPFAQPGARFGDSVDLCGPDIVVGAPLRHAPNTTSGEAYLLNADGSLRATLNPGDLNYYDEFGTAVAISEGRIAVGAPYDDETGLESGSVYFFDVTGAPTGKFIASTGLMDDLLGEAIALDGDLMLVSARERTSAHFLSGSVYLVSLTTGVERELFPSDGNQVDHFGTALALRAGRLVVGAPGADDVATNAGAAYVLRLDPGWRLGPGGTWFGIGPNLRWHEAEAEAQSFGGHLAHIPDSATGDWIAAQISEEHWIGYGDGQVEGQFEWTNGAPSGYENWAVGEPNGGVNENAVAITPAGTWIDADAEETRYVLYAIDSPDCDGDQVPDRYEARVRAILDFDGDERLDACVPATYCGPANQNSLGLSAKLHLGGTPILGRGKIRLEVTELPPLVPAVWLASSGTGFMTPPGSSGNLCLAPGFTYLTRADGTRLYHASRAGVIKDSFDFASSLQPGDRMHFQLWYRDGTTSHFSDAATVRFR